MRHLTALLVLICCQFLDIRIEDLLKCVPAAFSVYQSKVTWHSLPDFHCWAGFNKTVFLSQYSQLLQICSGLAEPVPPVLHNSEVSSHSKDPLLRRWVTQQWTVFEKDTLYFLPFVYSWRWHQVFHVCVVCVLMFAVNFVIVYITKKCCLWFPHNSCGSQKGLMSCYWMTTRCPDCLCGRDVSAQSFQECVNVTWEWSTITFFSSRFDQL